MYAIVTTAFLFVLAVQHRENAGDSIGPGGGTAVLRRQQTDVFEDLETTDHEQSVLGIFLVVNLDDVDDQNWNSTVPGSSPQVQLLHLHACTDVDCIGQF